MPELPHSLSAWNSPAFAQTLKSELEHLLPGTLPLDKGVTQGGMVDDSEITATIINFHDSATLIQAKVGIFFTEIVINCGCGDDPMPTNAYCEMQVLIDKTHAATEFKIIQDQ